MQRDTFRPLRAGTVKLLPGLFKQRYDLNRRYIMELRNEHLLQNFYQEAGLWSARHRQETETIHGGWEFPTCQLRGHFLGHWLSAAAHLAALAGDGEAKAKADVIVAELGRVQKENGGEWAGSIPPTYLDWIARGKRVWAPHYTLHKTLMGLYDMYALTGNGQALDILINWAHWFHRWTGQFTRTQMDNILDVETGGMLEVWANLYGVTGQQEHLDLLYRYDRPRLFDRMLAGEDVLTNMHANTTIPEAHGAARAWEVTGDGRWRQIVDAYWEQAVTRRGFYCTGSQTCGEIWTPPQELSTRLGDKNQEHCVVYNMMRLADYLLRWTGDVCYADYWERNLYNGILAQQHPGTGMIAYFLPLHAGGVKRWGTPTEDFWCCHGTLVQAHPLNLRSIYYEDAEGLTISQYIPSQATWSWQGTDVSIRQSWNPQHELADRPKQWVIDIAVECAAPTEFTLKVRLPWWLAGEAAVTVDGATEILSSGAATFHAVHRIWQKERIRVELPKAITLAPLPDRPETAAFLDGPIVLAGLVDEERTLVGDGNQPSSMLSGYNEREWTTWQSGYQTRNQLRNFRLLPLYEIRDEPYTVYFPIAAPSIPSL
jgi:DUF1680 family protein